MSIVIKTLMLSYIYIKVKSLVLNENDNNKSLFGMRDTNEVGPLGYKETEGLFYFRFYNGSDYSSLRLEDIK